MDAGKGHIVNTSVAPSFQQYHLRADKMHADKVKGGGGGGCDKTTFVALAVLVIEFVLMYENK